MSAGEGQEIAHVIVHMLKTLHRDQSFDLFWSKVNQFGSSDEVSEPQLPPKRERPRRFECVSARDFHETLKQYYWQQYFN